MVFPAHTYDWDSYDLFISHLCIYSKKGKILYMRGINFKVMHAHGSQL